MLKKYNVTKEQLKTWYEIEKRSYRWIMKALDIKNNRAIKKLLNFCEIRIRERSESIEAQWFNNESRRKKTSEKLKEIRHTIKIIHSAESKAKIGFANKGDRNGMSGHVGSKNPNYKVGKKSWEKGRKLDKKTRIEIIKTLGNKCETCGSIENLTIHHSPPWREIRSHDLKYLHCLCSACHFSLHHLVR